MKKKYLNTIPFNESECGVIPGEDDFVEKGGFKNLFVLAGCKLPQEMLNKGYGQMYNIRYELCDENQSECLKVIAKQRL